VARYESAAVRDEGKALVADYESQLAAVTKESHRGMEGCEERNRVREI
jgi:hypothetical protein